MIRNRKYANAWQNSRARIVGLSYIIIMLTTVACQPLQPLEVQTRQSSDAAPPAEAAAPEENSMIELSDTQRLLVSRAQDELAAELGVTPEEIDLVSVEEVDWPDASLGCPQEGMMYAQVITPGYRFLLGLNDETHEFHSSLQADGLLVRCESR